MRKNVKKRVLACICILCLGMTVLTGCGGEKEKEEETASLEDTGAYGRGERKEKADTEASETDYEEEEESSEMDDIDPETMELIKYNVYVEFNNTLVEMMNNIDNYFLAVEQQEEFSLIDGGKPYGYGLVGIDQDILGDALFISEYEPMMGDLDGRVADIADSMQTLTDVFYELRHSNNYADNQYAKAKEYHQIIWENTEEFYIQAEEFVDALDVIADERVAEAEAGMLEEGRLIIYNSSHVITLMQDIMDECYEQGVNDENLNDLDTAPIREMHEEILECVEAYNAACADNDQLIKESLSNSAPFDGLLDSAAQSVEWMINQAESGEPVTDIDLTPLGSLGHVYEVTSQCIERYNTVFAE